MHVFHMLGMCSCMMLINFSFNYMYVYVRLIPVVPTYGMLSYSVVTSEPYSRAPDGNRNWRYHAVDLCYHPWTSRYAA